MRQRIVITWPSGQHVIQDHYFGRSNAANQARDFIRTLEAHGVAPASIIAVRQVAQPDNGDWQVVPGGLDRFV